MRNCQGKLHVWGAANQVCFDKTKEHFAILHKRKCYGENFKLLGVVFDTQLKMEQMVCEMAGQGHSRISMIMRCRRFYAPVILLRFYKSFVLSFLEFLTPAIYHATLYALSPLDRVQKRKLRELQISEIDVCYTMRLYFYDVDGTLQC